MSTQVSVRELPPCDMPGCTSRAQYDAKTVHGPWAYMCPKHFRTHAASPFLGTGRGQRLVVDITNEEVKP